MTYSFRCLAFTLSFLFITMGFAMEFQAGAGIQYFDYKEDVPVPAKSTETGWILVPRLEANLPLRSSAKDSHFVNFAAELTGTVTTVYDGTYNDATYTPVQATNKHQFINLEFTGNFKLLPRFYLVAGYGSRTWTRLLTAGTEYKEIYSWTYLPVGFQFGLMNGNSFKMDLSLLYKQVLNAKIKVIFSESVTTGDDSEMALGKKPGYKISLPMKIRLANKLGLAVTPFYETSALGQSEAVYNSTPVSGGGVLGYIYEPTSRTFQYGMNVMGIFTL